MTLGAIGNNKSNEGRAWSGLLGQDPLAGLVLLGVGGFALYDSADLRFGSLAQFGPGLLPRLLAIGVVLSGLFILTLSAFSRGEEVRDFRLRAPIFIGAALASFALTITPFGLIVAAPLTIVIASLADPQTRLRESIALAALLTAASILIFGQLLNLSVPSLPPQSTLEMLTAILR